MRYLVVAYQTATSPELAARLAQLADDDPEPTWITLLVPAREEPPGSELQARRQAEQAAAHLEAGAGVHVAWSTIGDVDPLRAIEHELSALPGEYDGIVLSTLPPGISRWLALEAPTEAERRFGLPVVHVIAQPAR